MNNLWLALQGAGNVLLAGLILGAGLPAIFALGIRALSYGAGGSTSIDDHRPHPVGKLLAALCFGIVILAILLGIGVIVAHGFGVKLVFQGIWPTFVSK